MPLLKKIETIATQIYGAGEVSAPKAVTDRLREFEKLGYGGLPVCMAKTQYSFSSDPEHDWHYLLGAMHMLPADHFFAFLIRVAAFVIWSASIAFAVWLLTQMQKQ